MCKFRRVLCVALVLYLCLFCGFAFGESEPAVDPPSLWVAGTNWVNIDELDAGEPLRLWVSIVQADEAMLQITPETNIIGGDLPLSNFRMGLLTSYATQMELLKPDVKLDADTLQIYIIDSRLTDPIAIPESAATLDDLFRAAKGESEASALNRTFTGKANPLGVIRSTYAAYLKRVATAASLEPSEDDIMTQAKAAYEEAQKLETPQSGFFVLFAPEGRTAPPNQVEIRTPLDIASFTTGKPKGHASESSKTIAATDEQLKQARIKSGVFLDIRLYNNGKQLTFKQKTGKCDSGKCVDFILYGKPATYDTLELAATNESLANLKSLGVDMIHIRIAPTGGVGHWLEFSID